MADPSPSTVLSGDQSGELIDRSLVARQPSGAGPTPTARDRGRRAVDACGLRQPPSYMSPACPANHRNDTRALKVLHRASDRGFAPGPWQRLRRTLPEDLGAE